MAGIDIQTGVKTGAFTGVAAASNLELGFIPQYFRLINTTTKKEFIWVKGMTAGYAFKIETTTADNAYITSNGFTEYTGGAPTVSSGTTPGASTGITLGTAVQTTSDVCFWLAFA